MNGKTYLESAITTDIQDYQKVLDRLNNRKTLRLLHAAMGLCTEAGEFMDAIKKHILYGKVIDETNLIEELGDKFWYAALALDELKKLPEEVWDINIAKLKARYPNKFTETEAINRDLEKERKILEST